MPATISIQGRRPLRAKSAGNVGYSLSQLIAESVSLNSRVILEVSSFQSRGLRCLEAENGIWTNFSEDHLDYHGSLEDYFFSKLSLISKCKKEIFIGRIEIANINDLPKGHSHSKKQQA